LVFVIPLVVDIVLLRRIIVAGDDD
jgi:hypothetical protein